VFYGDLPPLFVEPNELFGVLVTVLRLVIEASESPGGFAAIRTSLSADGKRVRTEIQALDAPLSEKISSIIEPVAGTPEELSPFHFEWALARETVEAGYEGSLTWKVEAEAVFFMLELPLTAK
jgi:hypothetical protein